MTSVALLLYPGLGLALSECKQWWSLDGDCMRIYIGHMPAYLSVGMSVCRSVWLFLCLCLSARMYNYLSAFCLSVYVSVCIYICLFVCMSLSVRLSFYMTFSVHVCLFMAVGIYVCMSVCQ